ncbi:MAG: hypothetical protein IT384_18945 [Deltaproteobacteria bacterium]|nr:hypothetical protein [Deltaproteobacteria bacterium]
MPKAGGPPEVLALRETASPESVVYDGADLYWTAGQEGDGHILRWASGTGEVTVVASGQFSAHGLAVDAERLYWIYGLPPRVRTCRKSGGPVTEIGSASNTHRVVLDESHLYWTDFTSAGRTVLWQVPKADPAARVPLAEGFADNYGGGITLRPGAVYWSANVYDRNRPDGSCASFPYPGCTRGWIWRADTSSTGTVSIVVTEDSAAILDLDVDDRGIVWTTEVAIKRAALDGSAPEVVVDSPGRPRGILLDGDYVYWLNARMFSDVLGASGDVLRVRR